MCVRVYIYMCVSIVSYMTILFIILNIRPGLSKCLRQYQYMMCTGGVAGQNTTDTAAAHSYISIYLRSKLTTFKATIHLFLG